MKIVHVNSSSSGGAYRAAVGLHKGLLDLSVNSTFFTQGTIQGDNFVRFHEKHKNKVVSFLNKLHFKSIIRERSRYCFERFGKPSYFEDPVVIWGPASPSEFPPQMCFTSTISSSSLITKNSLAKSLPNMQLSGLCMT